MFNRNQVSTILTATVMALSLLAASCSTTGTDSGHVSVTHETSVTPLSVDCLNASNSTNPIQAENTCPGTTSWNQDRPFGPTSAIEGYANPISVDKGQQVQLYVSTTARTFAYQVFRLGWYQGNGARLMLTSALNPGVYQSAPSVDPTTHLLITHWIDPVALAIPTTWVSGIYVVKLLSSQGYMRYTWFVVRDDTHPKPILFQTSALTDEAYNYWGGLSLYEGKEADSSSYVPSLKAYAVSFDRPFADFDGLSYLVRWEMPLLRWMERKGYSMSYVADVDADSHPASFASHKLIVDAGHDEYWSQTMRQTFANERDSGTSLAFFGANDVYWRIRLASSALGADRIIICYRVATLDPVNTVDPQNDTVRWRDPAINQPEDALLGEQYAGIIKTFAPLVLTNGAAPFLGGTGLHVGESLPMLVGGEFDHIALPQSPSISLLADSPISCTVPAQCQPLSASTASLYTAPSGAHVFDAGSFNWTWGLDTYYSDPYSKRPASVTNSGFQQFTANLLSYMMNV
jgi:hypothetical protein